MTDLLVVGGGPAGAACAITAANSGASVTLIDDGRRVGTWPGESLPPGGRALIERVFGPAILDAHQPTYLVRSAWGSPELVETDFISTTAGDGVVLDRSRFDGDVRIAARSAGVSVVEGRATAITGSPGAWQVGGSDGAVHIGAWVVDATGRSSSIAARLGARRDRADDLVALVATAPDDGDGPEGTLVEAVPDGWWYSTCLPQGGRVFALLTDADALPAPDDRARWWHEQLELTEHVHQLLAGVAANPAVHRADTSSLDALHGPGWAAVGDAAVAWDPLSSQGVISAVLMGARAGSAIATGESLNGWAEDYRMLEAEHRAMQRHYYGLEQRWPDSSFWRRRLGTVPSA